MTKAEKREFDKWWKRYLASEGDVLLTANPKLVGNRMSYTVVNQTTVRVGLRNVHRKVQRTFTLGSPTKVPRVIAEHFLNDQYVVEWDESMRITEDDVLDAEVIV